MRRLAAGVVVAALGCAAAKQPVAFDEPARAAVADAIRSESARMLDVMRGRNVDSVLAFYGKHTAYVGNGQIGDWAAILAGAPPRYATYTKVDCKWGGALRVDVLAPEAAVVTARLICDKADSTGKAWTEDVARTEVMGMEDGRWRIVAVHESAKSGELK